MKLLVAKIVTLTFLSLSSSVLFADSNPYSNDEPAYKWYTAGEQTVAKSQNLFPNKQRAKNVILFVGDGMGITTITAARILDGQQKKISGESNQLSFEKFPFVALSKTYNTNQQVADSAGTMTAMITGVKTNAGVLSVDETVKYSDYAQVKGHILSTLIEQAEDWGLATGIVTTTRITHATPAAAYAHTSNRDWENDALLSDAARKAGVLDIAAQFLEFSHGDGINLVLGGGRGNFLPNDVADGQRLDGRNLINEWKKKYPQGIYVEDSLGFANIDWDKTDNVLGLFHPAHMNYHIDRSDTPNGEPTLSEMTEKAIQYLSRYPEGYILIVEGGRVDHGHHAGNAHRALTDAIELANAVAVADKMTSSQDTLMIVTADHSHVMTMNGYPVRNNPILGKVVQWNETTGVAELAKDKHNLPYTTLQYANGPGARTRTDLTAIDTAAPDYKQDALVLLESETHGGEDVPVYARGPGAMWVHGVMEQNVIYHIMRNALGR